MTVEKKTIRRDIPHSTHLSTVSADDARRLVVPREVTLSGDISACENLVVDGTVQAALFTARRLEVTETGFFGGKADVQDAVIAGRFEGKLTVTGRLVVKSTGHVYGEIMYGSLDVHAGARIEGQISPAPVPVAAAKPAVATVAAAPLPSNVEPLFDTQAGETTKDSPKVFRRAGGF